MTEIKCDLCNRVVDPAEGGWTYLTPKQVDTVEEAEATGVFWAEDEYWLACKGCEPFVEANDLMNLGRRWIMHNAELLTEKHLEYAVGVLKAFMIHKTTRAYEDVISPVGVTPPAEAFS